MYKNEHKFPYRWTKKDANFTKDKGKVMSCFCCGGGSSFGYKLAGYDVVACNEIDPKVMKMYLKNHDVKYAFNCNLRKRDMSLEQFRSEITRQAKGLLNGKASFQVKMSLAYGLIEEHFDRQIEFYFEKFK